MPTCRQCGDQLKSGSTVTCLKSTCQEAEYHANKARNAPKKRNLKPKVGAKKADGTVWTKQPGGIEKLEVRNGPNDPWFNNELQFARLIVGLMSVSTSDEGAWLVLLQDLQKTMGLNESQLTSIFMRANDVCRKAGLCE